MDDVQSGNAAPVKTRWSGLVVSTVHRNAWPIERPSLVPGELVRRAEGRRQPRHRPAAITAGRRRASEDVLIAYYEVA